MKAKELIKILEKTPNHEVVLFNGVSDEHFKFEPVGGVEKMMATRLNGKKARTVFLYHLKTKGVTLELKPIKAQFKPTSKKIIYGASNQD